MKLLISFIVTPSRLLPELYAFYSKKYVSVNIAVLVNFWVTNSQRQG